VTVDPIPDSEPRLMPYLTVDGADAAITFYVDVFGGQPGFRLPAPDGQKVMHAEVAIGDMKLLLSDAFPEWGVQDPKSLGGSPVALHLYVADVDATNAAALAAGAEQISPPEDMFYGDRTARLRDPWGHVWTLASRQRVLSEDEINTAAAEWMKSF